MLVDHIRRPAVCLGLSAALLMSVPGGGAFAAVHEGPNARTITPEFAATFARGEAESRPAGVIEVAQNNRNQKVRRHNTRKEVRRHNNVKRAKHANRVYRHGRWWYYRDNGYYDSAGIALAGVVGLAAGAIAGAAIAGSNNTVVVDTPYEPYSAEWYRQCSLKYRSFRASDGTYLGYDGVRHTCRIP